MSPSSSPDERKKRINQETFHPSKEAAGTFRLQISAPLYPIATIPPPRSITQMDSPPSKSWSIHTRREITSKYQILERVGSGAYSDVYKARRLSDNLIVALKEVHDYQSAFREIEALQTLQHCPNVVVLHQYFWSEDEDAVLVLEYLPTDLSDVIRAAKKGEWRDEGLRFGEIKRWMIQILCGVDACHRSSIVHRDLKPTNLLISADGVLKLADFGQVELFLAIIFHPFFCFFGWVWSFDSVQRRRQWIS